MEHTMLGITLRYPITNMEIWRRTNVIDEVEMIATEMKLNRACSEDYRQQMNQVDSEVKTSIKECPLPDGPMTSNVSSHIGNKKHKPGNNGGT